MPGESLFWAYLKPKLFGRWYRIESPTTAGIPDVVGLLNKQTIWLELKSVNTYCDGLGLSPLQCNWAENWNNEGGKTFLCAKVGKEILLVPGCRLTRGRGESLWKDKAVHVTRVGQFDHLAFKKALLENYKE